MIKTGRVYKIVCSLSDDVYIGSTLNELRVRWWGHKSDFKKWEANDSRGTVTIFPIFEKYGLENFKIILIKEYAVLDKEHLRAYEQLWISRTRCVNQKNPFCIKRLNQIQHAERNKEALAEYRKEWAINNQEKIQASRSKRQSKTNEKNKEKIECECGTLVSRRNQAMHRKSQQHILWTQRQQETEEDRLKREQSILDKQQESKKKRRAYHKEWSEKNKDHIRAYVSETMTCGCGSSFTKRKRTVHEKSQKHITWANLQYSSL